MRRTPTFLLFVTLICVVVVPAWAHGQPWSGIIAPSRAVDWSNAGIPGGIPNRTTICATLSPGATATQVNSAIAACPPNQVVSLSAGTFNIGGIIFGAGKSNVTLRGAGAGQTRIVFTPGAATACHGFWANVCITGGAELNYPDQPQHTATWTATSYAKGQTQITLSNTTGLAVGNPLILDQENDTTDDGFIYVCEVGGPIGSALRCNDDGADGGPSGGQRSGRGQIQIVTVTAINGKVVTFSPGLYMPNWSSAKSPGAWWQDQPVHGIGIENLSVDHTGSREKAGTVIWDCSGCWVKGIRSINSNRSHVWVVQSPHTVVRDSYFFGTKNAVSQSYGVEMYPSSDSLVENNIFQHITSPQMINAACSGCVVAYNFSINDYYAASASYMMQAAWIHAGGIDNMLFEGNVGNGLYSDNFHGTHHFLTIFRNRYNGKEASKTDHTIALDLSPFSRMYNVIGNVFGESGWHSSSRPIFAIGEGSDDVLDDPETGTTLMRWGNYDVVSAANRFVAAEVPSGLSQFPNPVPASPALPASLYLSGKPGWFGTVAWPPIGPDVTGGNIANVAGHANQIPAQVCYSNVMGGPADGSGNVLNFDANSCYNATSAPRPNPPSNFKIITVQ